MKSLRLLAGWLCVALGFALVILLSFGVFDPVVGTGESWVPLLAGLLPSVSVGIALFALGVWLIGGRPR